MKRMRRWLDKVLDAIFPENYTCIICNEELRQDDRYNLCDKCKTEVLLIQDKSCVKCGALLIADSSVCTDCKYVKRVVDKNYSAVLYDGGIRRVIHEYKYNNKKYLKKPLGRMLYDKYLQVLTEYKPDIIVAVPLYSTRLRERSFNQTELLMSMFETDIELFNFDAVIRVKDTPHQASLSKEERVANISGAFKVNNPKIFEGKNVLIVDDIFTSGATIDECARVINKCSPKCIRSLTLGHSHKEQPLEIVNTNVR